MRAAASSSHTARLAGIGLLPRSIARIDVSRAWSRLASSPLVQPICRSSASIRSFVTALGRARRARHHFRPLLNSWGHARTLMFGVSSAAAILASATAPVWGRSIVVLPASPRQSANAIGAYEFPKGALSAHWSRLARRCKAITALGTTAASHLGTDICNRLQNSGLLDANNIGLFGGVSMATADFSSGSGQRGAVMWLTTSTLAGRSPTTMHRAY